MSYLIGKILFCLLLAFLLGLILSWIFKSTGARREQRRLQGEVDLARGKMLQQQRSSDQLKAELATSNANSAREIVLLNSRIGDLEPFERRVTELEPLQGRVAELEPLVQKSVDYEHEIITLNARNSALEQQLDASEQELVRLRPIKNAVADYQQRLSLLQSENQTVKQQALRDNSKLAFKLNSLTPVQTELAAQNKAMAALHSAHQQETSALGTRLEDAIAELQREKHTSSQIEDLKHKLLMAESMSIKANEEIERIKTEAIHSAVQNQSANEGLERELMENQATIEQLQSQIRYEARLGQDMAGKKPFDASNEPNTEQIPHNQEQTDRPLSADESPWGKLKSVVKSGSLRDKLSALTKKGHDK